MRDFGFHADSRLRSRWRVVDRYWWHSRESRAIEGIPYVLVHGLNISSLYMIPLGECLARESRVLAVDLPGFGRSGGPQFLPSIPERADQLVHWMDAAGIERCHLVANSLGCQVVADLSARYSERVETLTLIGPTIDPHAHSLWTQIGRLLVEFTREPPRLLVNHVVDFLRAGPIRLLSMVRWMFADRIVGKLPRIIAPVLVLRGERDDIAPESWTEEAARIIPSAEAMTFPGAAHCVHYTHPIETARVIQKFVAENTREYGVPA